MRTIRFSSYFTLLGLFTVLNTFAQNHNDLRPSAYNISQAISDRAQLHTIAFDGLAFLTGDFGADCFFPPGKVADFFGFQFMRDNDKNKLGHNTDFLTRIASNVISILNTDQLNKLKQLAVDQEQLYDKFANKRIVLISAFRKSLENPSFELSKEAVVKFCGDLYLIDAELSYNRAKVVGLIIRSLTDEQKKKLELLSFNDSSTWPDIPELLDKRSMSHRANVGVMTYASELFSWYKGNIDADIYFCPERHGTYFGGFYLKDYPAMGNKKYFISTSLTGDAGKSFLDLLTSTQRTIIEVLPEKQKGDMEKIVAIRKDISNLLRGFMEGKIVKQDSVYSLIKSYGEIDGLLSFEYASAFISVNSSLTSLQHAKLKELRGLDVFPKGIYIYSDPTPKPDYISNEELFNSNKKKGF